MFEQPNPSQPTLRQPRTGGPATPLALRPRDRLGLSDSEVLARYRPGKAEPMEVLELDEHEPLDLQAGDFVLVPAAFGVAMSSLEPPRGTAQSLPVALGDGYFRVGRQQGPTDLRMLGGRCSFGSPDAALLVSLLPSIVHVRGEERLATLVQLLGQETRSQRPAREVVLARLLEVLLIEALRSTTGTEASPGLVRGLADPRLAAGLRAMHQEPTRAWTVSDLAKEAALSRSTFFERFKFAVGVAPMEYLLEWRMARMRPANSS